LTREHHVIIVLNTTKDNCVHTGDKMPTSVSLFLQTTWL